MKTVWEGAVDSPLRRRLHEMLTVVGGPSLNRR